MAMNTEKSSKPALHNFTMPCDLRWGNQRFLRCMRVNPDGRISPLRRFAAATAASQNHHRHPSISIHHRQNAGSDRDRRESPVFGSGKVDSIRPLLADHGIAAVREKVMFDLQTAADRMKDAIFKKGLQNGQVFVDPAPSRGEAHAPWSLRTRRAAGKSTPFGGFSPGVNTEIGIDGGDGNCLKSSPVAAGKSPTLTSCENRGREKFSVALSKRAVEEDFFAMASHRPPRRPKKRPKMVQKQLDSVFPGLWLTEVTPDMYKVMEPAT